MNVAQEIGLRLAQGQPAWAGMLRQITLADAQQIVLANARAMGVNLVGCTVRFGLTRKFDWAGYFWVQGCPQIRLCVNPRLSARRTRYALGRLARHELWHLGDYQAGVHLPLREREAWARWAEFPKGNGRHP